MTASKPTFPSSAKISNNPNDNSHLSVMGMIETLILNFIMFIILLLIFESNRFYKQIYLKRLQNKFRASDRVPPYPSESTFGWFFEISKVSEAEVLRMVGLDAYMCLRYISICWKLCLFLSFWGILVLLPIYATAADPKTGNPWDQYSIVNLKKGDYGMEDRLWVTAMFSYIFAAYFCQLLFYEYKNFSIRRLQFLLQADPDGPDLDPDTPPQKYYTVMIEHIPGKMRSAAALREFFERIFPGDVYTVEIALDIKELDALNAKRKRLRNKLEKAIAHYEASNERPQVYARTGIYDYDDLTDGIFGDDDILTFIRKSLQPEKFGYSKVDAMQYYTGKLLLFNEEFMKLQLKYNELANKTDKQMMKLFEEKFDTRAAAFLENITVQGAKALKNIAAGVPPSAPAPAGGGGTSTPPRTHEPHSPTSPHIGSKAKKILHGFKIEDLVFGAKEDTDANGGLTKARSFHTALNEELRNLEAITDEERREIEQRRRRHSSSYVTDPSDPRQHPRAGAHHHRHVDVDVFTPPDAPHHHRHSSHGGGDTSTTTAAAGGAKSTSFVEVDEGSSSGKVKSHHPFEHTVDHGGASYAPPPLIHPDFLVASASTATTNGNVTTTIRESTEDGGTATHIPGMNLATTTTVAATTTGDSDTTAEHATLANSFKRPSFATSTSMKPAGFDLLTQDPTIGEWIRKSDVDFEKEEIEVSRKRSESLAQAHDIYRRDAQAELRAYMAQESLMPALSAHGNLNNVSGIDLLSGMSTHSVRRSVLGVPLPSASVLAGSSHGGLPSSSRHHASSSIHGPGSGADDAAAHGAEIDRAAQLSSMTRSLLSQSTTTAAGAAGAAATTATGSSGASVVTPGSTAASQLFSTVHPIPEEYEYDDGELSPPAYPRGAGRADEEFGQYDDLEDRNGQPIGGDSSVHSSSRHGGDAVASSSHGVSSVKQRLSATAHSIQQMMHQRTQTGGVSSVLPVNMLTSEQLNDLAKLSAQQARTVTKQGWLQTTLAGRGAWHGLIEVERMIEMIMLGALHKYSSTAFVTFNSRITESIAQQMLLSHDQMEINHAPNPHDIIWENIAIPKSQVVMRNYITNIGVIVGSIFWSSLVNSVNVFAQLVPVNESQQQIASAGIMLIFLIILPYIFDYVARYYEGLKLESEIQNSIMTRYFYYQLINIYVTVGFSGSNLWAQLLQTLTKPQTLVDVIGGRMPNVSMFFANLMIVKILTAIPLEMIRPWQLSTIQLMGHCMDKRRTTRRDLRTGVFYSWPMLYGWIYPQLMMVLMIMVTYSTITPLLSPLGVIFFAVAYWMYKYQLLYVYINEYQSGGYMWYAVFHYTMVAMEFAACTLVGYLSLQLTDPRMAGPFFFTLPLPLCLIYFGSYCEKMFLRASMSLSYGFAKELDLRDQERRRLGKSTPHDSFSKTCYRQPSLTEGNVYPEPFRDDGSYIALRDLDTQEMTVSRDWRNNRRGSLSINVHELTDEGEENALILETYFNEVVVPLSRPPKKKKRKLRKTSIAAAAAAAASKSSHHHPHHHLHAHHHHRRGVDGGHDENDYGSDEYTTGSEYESDDDDDEDEDSDDVEANHTQAILLNSSNVVRMARQSYEKAEAATEMLSKLPLAMQQKRAQQKRQQQPQQQQASKAPLLNRRAPTATSRLIPDADADANADEEAGGDVVVEDVNEEDAADIEAGTAPLLPHPSEDEANDRRRGKKTRKPKEIVTRQRR